MSSTGIASLLSSGILDLKDSILDLVFPPHCLLCQAMGRSYLCETCLDGLILEVPKPYCARCGYPLPGGECNRCSQFPARLIRVRSLGMAEGGLQECIHMLKYRDKPVLAPVLGQLLANYALERSRLLNDLVFDTIVPVPLHPVRQRLRGYNQSERLAHAFGALVGVRISTQMVRRVKSTHQQVGLAREKRLSNLSGAFAADSQLVEGKIVLLIDDVATTGSTLAECAKALEMAGAEEIYALTLAAG